MKVVLLVGISGAYRCDEMVKMTMGDIKDSGSLVYIKVPDTKIKKKIYHRRREVHQSFQKICLFVDFIERRFFLKYKNAECQRSVMGIHTIGRVPKDVVQILNQVVANITMMQLCLICSKQLKKIEGNNLLKMLKRGSKFLVNFEYFQFGRCDNE